MAASEALPPVEPEDEAPEQLSPAKVRRRNARDLAMLALGVGSLGIIAYDFFYRSTLSPAQVLALEVLDLAVVLVFATEFAWRWRSHGWAPRFVLHNWFDVLGMVPMMATNVPLFRAFRLLRIGMVASRLLRMWAYVTGHQSAQVVFNRYRAALVEEVTDRVMLRTLGMVEDVAARGGHVRALGDSLGGRREDVAAAVLKGAREDGIGKVVGAVPGGEAALRAAVLSTVDSLVVTLRSEEMQRTFEDAVRALIAETRKEVQRKSWREDHQPSTAPLLPGQAWPAGPS